MKYLSLAAILVPVLAGMVLPFTEVTAQEQKSPVRAETLSWDEQMSSALARAKKLHRPILVNFTGSDWCGWCIRLDKEVFSTPAFKEYAANNLVLLKIDFPRNKWQTPAERKANMDLARRYNVQGYPTILLLNSRGEVIARTGYRRGGGTAYVQHLQKLLMRKK